MPSSDKVSINIIPKYFSRMHTHRDAMQVLERVGVRQYVSLPAWGIGIKRAYHLMNSMKEYGMAKIQDSGVSEDHEGNSLKSLKDAKREPISLTNID